jgi:thiol-disulfide isomerase/thioredoxin
MRFLILLYLIACNTGSPLAQSTFVLSGSTNLLRNGKATLTEIAPEGFYSNQLRADTVVLSNGHFVFKGRIKNPQQYRLVFFTGTQKYITEPFFVDRGQQSASIDSAHAAYHFLDLGYGVLMTGSKAHYEYSQQLLPRFSVVNKQMALVYDAIDASDTLPETGQKLLMKRSDTLFKEYRRQRDSILLQYAMERPRSPILPWYLYGRIRKFGYNEYYQQAAQRIAPHIPITMADYLLVYLSSLKKNTAGNRFPLLEYIQQQAPSSLPTKGYLLVEFWFSSCAPCIAQFEELRPLYNIYNPKGFEILAIATDAKATEGRYRRLLQAKQYPWPQLLDLSAVQSAIMDIHKYPSSFLLDGTGNIIATDIKPATLEDFLKEHL